MVEQAGAGEIGIFSGLGLMFCRGAEVSSAVLFAGAWAIGARERPQTASVAVHMVNLRPEAEGWLSSTTG